MEKIGDKIRGLAKIRLTGAQPAELLNALAAENIEFWGLQSEGDPYTLLLKIALRHRRRFFELAEAAGCSCKVLELSGGRLWLGRLRKRKVLWVLPLLCAAALAASSLFVWRIDVEGTENVSKTEILSALRESGVYIGSFHPAFTGDMIRSRVMLRIPELKWISVSVLGSRAIVTVREKTEAPELSDKKTPVALVAEQAGIVEEISVLRGEGCIKAGQTAAKGDILIAAAVPGISGEIRLVHAMGSVKARTWYQLSAVIPTEYLQISPADTEKTRYALILGNLRINFYRNSGIIQADCDNIITERALGIKDVFCLPVSVVKESSRGYNTSRASLTPQEIRTELMESLLAQLKMRMGEEGELISANISYGSTGALAIATLRAECVQRIDAERPLTGQETEIILSENNNSKEP